jgi:glycerophosphoryl diester phosphodiesterase
MNTIKIKKGKTKMIAHRGLSGLEKENTAVAFIAAGNRSYFGTECDIHLSKDNVFMVSHDGNTGRVAPVDKIIKECPAAELQEICLYNDGPESLTKNYLRLPTFEEYLFISKKYEKHCVIELKPEFTIFRIEVLIELLHKYDYLKKVTLISFNYNNLATVRLVNKDITLQLLTSEPTPELLDKCVAIKADLDLNHTKATKELIDDVHARGMKINVWTVNNPVLAEQYVEWGVDFITTNILE